MAWLSNIRFDATHEREDGQTDTHTQSHTHHTDTALWHIPRLCIASRGKNEWQLWLYGEK